jgi:hypothetical protein
MDLEIYADNEILGTITIGHGSFTWRGAGRRTVWTFPWSEFAELMNKRCYGD